MRVWKIPHGILARWSAACYCETRDVVLPAENLGNQQGLDVLRSEEDSSDSCDHDQTGHDSVAVSEALRDETVDEETDDLSYIGSVAETCLPARRYLVCSVGQQYTVFLVELGVRVEGSKKTDVVTFHSDTGRDKDTPEDGLGIQLDTLPESHVVFLLGSDFGICDGQVVGFGLGDLILVAEVERFTSNFRHDELSLSCWIEGREVASEEKELLRMNCWEIASFMAFKYHRPDDPADFSWNFFRGRMVFPTRGSTLGAIALAVIGLISLDRPLVVPAMCGESADQRTRKEAKR